MAASNFIFLDHNIGLDSPVSTGTVQLWPLGLSAQAKHDTYGVGEFVYVQGSTNAAGMPVILQGGTAKALATAVNNGSAALTPAVKSRIFKALPNVIVLDVVGASETGMQMSSFAFNGAEGDAATFAAQPDTAVVDDGFTRLLEPGEGGGATPANPISRVSGAGAPSHAGRPWAGPARRL